MPAQLSLSLSPCIWSHFQTSLPALIPHSPSFDRHPLPFSCTPWSSESSLYPSISASSLGGGRGGPPFPPQVCLLFISGATSASLILSPRPWHKLVIFIFLWKLPILLCCHLPPQLCLPGPCELLKPLPHRRAVSLFPLMWSSVT